MKKIKKQNAKKSCLTILLSSSSLPKKKFHYKYIIATFLYHALPPCLILFEHLFGLSHRKTCWTMSMDNVGLKICLLGASNSIWGSLRHFFLGVNWSGRGMSSTTNHKFYKASGQLHGPWCKQPLTLPSPWRNSQSSNAKNGNSKNNVAIV